MPGHRKDIYAQNQGKNHEIAHEGLQQPVLRYLSIRDTNPGPCQGPMDGGFAIGSYISNAMGSTRLKSFVWLSGVRWAIEQCFEEAKTELGMDHYEVRKWPGWIHHMMTCMLAHFFLWHIKVRLGEKNTSCYSVTTPAFA